MKSLTNLFLSIFVISLLVSCEPEELPYDELAPRKTHVDPVSDTGGDGKDVIDDEKK